MGKRIENRIPKWVASQRTWRLSFMHNNVIYSKTSRHDYEGLITWFKEKQIELRLATVDYTTKICRRCKVERPINEFNLGRKYRIGQCSTCDDIEAKKGYQRRLARGVVEKKKPYSHVANKERELITRSIELTRRCYKCT